MGYYVLVQVIDKRTANIAAHPRGMPIDDWEFDEGTSLADRFPEGAKYRFDDDEPDARKVVDHQGNTLGLFIVSPAFRQVLAAEPKVEFLPIQLLDHRGKNAAEGYSIANFLEPLDVMDMDASEYKENHIEEGLVSSIKKLVIDPAKIPDERRIFRMSSKPTLVLMDEEMKKSIEAAGLTGLGCIPVDEFESTSHLGV